MPNILITGARSAAALDLARQFSALGHRVYLGDSFSEALGFRSNRIHGRFLWSSPRHEFLKFKSEIIALAKKHEIQWIIPTCEEIFYLSQIEELKSLSFCWWDEARKIQSIHNKWLFNQKCQQLNLAVPKTKVLKSLQDYSQEHGFQNFVLKPVFSRFASQVIFSDDVHFLSQVQNKNESGEWLLQERIFGTEYCSYSLCYQGRILAHSVYGHEFTAGRGAGISFEAVKKEQIDSWVRRFVENEKFTGQIAFDFIEDSRGIPWCLESNPRATSGLHLLADHEEFLKAFLEPQRKSETIVEDKQKKILSRESLLIYGLRQVTNWRLFFSFLRALGRKEVIWTVKDLRPALAQIDVLFSFSKIAKKKNISVLQATTEDIEWNF